MNTKINLDPSHKTSSIINLPNAYNGRVNIISSGNPDARFQMFERIAVRNKATEYREALTGEWENSVLSSVFFSAENIQILQNGIRAGVYQKSNSEYVIPPQNIDVLKTIMRSMYVQYANHSAPNITKEIERLNQTVWDYTIPAVYGEVVGYMKYLQDQSTLVVPLELPQHIDRVYKQLELKPWF
jgi:hypothetical protein